MNLGQETRGGFFGLIRSLFKEGPVDELLKRREEWKANPNQILQIEGSSSRLGWYALLRQRQIARGETLGSKATARGKEYGRTCHLPVSKKRAVPELFTAIEIFPDDPKLPTSLELQGDGRILAQVADLLNIEIGTLPTGTPPQS